MDFPVEADKSGRVCIYVVSLSCQVQSAVPWNQQGFQRVGGPGADTREIIKIYRFHNIISDNCTQYERKRNHDNAARQLQLPDYGKIITIHLFQA
jgi:hypothetical protein